MWYLSMTEERMSEQPRWLLFVPMYNCERQIGRVLAQVTEHLANRIAEVFVVDNGSTDAGPQLASEAIQSLAVPRAYVVQNDDNYNLGGSHKVAFQRCLDQGYDGVVVFHGDDQGSLVDLLEGLPDWPAEECVLGSRFMLGSSLQGYALHRTLANVVFNGIYSVLARKILWDLGSGLNWYSRRFIERGLWRTCRDNLTFNYDLLLRTASTPGATFRFVPITWREDDQVSNAKLTRHGVDMLRILQTYGRSRRHFVETDRSGFVGERTWTVLAEKTGA